MVNLPDKTGLRWIAHPDYDAGARMKHSGLAAFINGSESFIIQKLRLAHKVGEIFYVAITILNGFADTFAARRAHSQIVLRPVVIDGFPIFLGHHAVDRFKRRDRSTANFSFESLAKIVVRAWRMARPIRPA